MLSFVEVFFLKKPKKQKTNKKNNKKRKLFYTIPVHYQRLCGYIHTVTFPQTGWQEKFQNCYSKFKG